MKRPKTRKQVAAEQRIAAAKRQKYERHRAFLSKWAARRGYNLPVYIGTRGLSPLGPEKAQYMLGVAEKGPCGYLFFPPGSVPVPHITNSFARLIKPEELKEAVIPASQGGGP